IARVRAIASSGVAVPRAEASRSLRQLEDGIRHVPSRRLQVGGTKPTRESAMISVHGSATVDQCAIGDAATASARRSCARRVVCRELRLRLVDQRLADAGDADVMLIEHLALAGVGWHGLEHLAVLL